MKENTILVYILAHHKTFKSVKILNKAKSEANVIRKFIV